jgi:DNA-binding MarR family transcriptional regulator
METETATPWLTEAEQCAWRTHLEVNRLLAYQLEKDLQPFGLTMNDYEILVNLSESEGVRRENCESDRRGLYAVLTEHGLETMRKVSPHHVASVRRHFMDLLEPESLLELDKALRPIAEHLRGQRGRP